MKTSERNRQLRRQIQQLILLRETGPKSAAWHAARARLIWRLHDELKQGQAELPERETARPRDRETGDTR